MLSVFKILLKRTSFVIHFYCRFLWLHGLTPRSKAASLLRFRVRVPPGIWMSVSCKCCVLSDRGLCDGSITRPEEPYRICLCMSLSVISCSNDPLHLQWEGRRGQTEKDRKKELLFLIYKALTNHHEINTFRVNFNCEYNNSVGQPTKLPNLT